MGGHVLQSLSKSNQGFIFSKRIITPPGKNYRAERQQTFQGFFDELGKITNFLSKNIKKNEKLPFIFPIFKFFSQFPVLILKVNNINILQILSGFIFYRGVYILKKSSPPSTVGYFRGSWGVTGFCNNTPLKMHLSCVHGENGQINIF